MKHTGYRYQPLGTSSHHVRLLTILPRCGKKTVQLTLEDVRLDGVKGHYDAVSYMWGPAEPYRHVLVDGKYFRIRDNIWRFLKHCRDTKLTLTRLWIDAICINQADNGEKSSQVTRMGDVFRFAERVLIWLNGTSDQPIINDKSASSSTIPAVVDPPRPDLWNWYEVLGERDERSLAIEDQAMRIVYHPYWRRLWILQEVSLASTVYLILGTLLLDEKHLRAIYSLARENSKPGYYTWMARLRNPLYEDHGTVLLDHHPIMFMRRFLDDPPEQRRLTELVKTHYMHQCSDPRDRVYGLLGITSSTLKPTVDYSHTAEELFVETLQCMDHEAWFHSLKRLNGVKVTNAAALVRALGVSRSSYEHVQKTLPTMRAKRLREPEFEVGISAFARLTPIQIDSWDDTMLSQNVMSMRTKSGQTKHFLDSLILRGGTPSSAPWDIEEHNTLLLLAFSPSPKLIIRKCSDHKLKIEHCVSYDLTRHVAESVLLLEGKLPSDLQTSLEAMLNSLNLDWHAVCHGEPFYAKLTLSAFEVLSLCELTSP